MTRRFYLAAAFAAALGAAPALAQKGISITDLGSAREPEDPKPAYKYELKPEHGEFLVPVKTFRGAKVGDSQVKEQAEGLAEYIRTECRLLAYVHESGWAMRQERKKEKEAVIAAAREHYQKEGRLTEEAIDLEIRKLVKMARLPDEYTVLVAPGKGSLKTWDEALEFAKYIHNLKAPPAQFCDAVMVGSSQDIASKHGEALNPFLNAIPGRNPTLPKVVPAAQRPKADEFLMSINSGETYSLIHKTKRPWTLVVKAYGGGGGQVVRTSGPGSASGPSDGALLERAAMQAHTMAEALRNMKPSFDGFVLHTRYESFVCVGEYDSKDDRQLKANAEALKSMQIKDQRTGQVLETFLEKPLPAMIPRP
jgi:hypothetical protein